MINRLVAIFFCLLLFFGCNKRPTEDEKPIEEKIIGKWKMVEIYDGKKDISKERNPKGDRVLEFKKDSIYHSSGRPFAPRSGYWHFNETKEILFMDSEAGPGDDSKWVVSFKNDTFLFHGKSPFIRTVYAKWVKI